MKILVIEHEELSDEQREGLVSQEEPEKKEIGTCNTPGEFLMQVMLYANIHNIEHLYNQSHLVKDGFMATGMSNRNLIQFITHAEGKQPGASN
jgi:hypothetical protein